jgi:excisionase family DNA binding protein
MSIGERYLRVKEVAVLLGICARGVWRLIASGVLPRPVHVGRCACLLESEVRAYMERIKRERGQ